MVEQNQVEDPLAMSLASLVMSRPGSVLDSSERPGSALSLLSMFTVQARARAKTAKMRAAVSLNSVDTSRGDVNSKYYNRNCFMAVHQISVPLIMPVSNHYSMYVPKPETLFFFLILKPYHLQILFSEHFTE